MFVSEATVADAAELNMLVNTSYRGERSKKGWATEAHLLDGNRIDEETVIEYLSNPAITILKYTGDDGELKACVYLEHKGDKLYLGMLSVLPELQAGGIGRLLLEEAEAFAKKKGIGTITMTVISSRTELLAWYVRRGYHYNGEILPFHADKKFGVPRIHIELAVLEKHIK